MRSTIQAKIIKRVLIVVNDQKESAPKLVCEMETYFSSQNILCDIARTSSSMSTIDFHPDTDLVITLGGDGTVLYCARLLQDKGIPILGVNLGTFGYITEISADEWKEAFELYRDGKAAVSRRLMIRVTVLRDGKRVYRAHGLNEMVIASSGTTKIVSLDLTLDTSPAGHFRADGMIISTPTGSTAYNLAAGGPILESRLDALVITPICPFTLSNRPLVVSGETQVQLTIPQGQRTEVNLTVDAHQLFTLREHDTVLVEKSRSKTLLITSPKRTYIEVIREKLNWSGEMHA